MSDTHVREATSGDAEALAAAYRDAYQQSEELGFPMKAASATAEQVEAWVRESLVLVADVEGILVGAVRLGRADERVAKLSRLGVRDDWSEEGIGSRLLSAAEQRARERDDERVRLTTPEDHPFLVEFYRSNGYEVTGDYPLDFREYDEVVMEKPL